MKAVPQGAVQFVEMRDSQDRKIDFNFIKVGDTQTYHYIQGLPLWGVTSEGTRVRIPQVKVSEVSNIYVLCHSFGFR